MMIEEKKKLIEELMTKFNNQLVELKENEMKQGIFCNTVELEDIYTILKTLGDEKDLQ